MSWLFKTSLMWSGTTTTQTGNVHCWDLTYAMNILRVWPRQLTLDRCAGDGMPLSKVTEIRVARPALRLLKPRSLSRLPPLLAWLYIFYIYYFSTSSPPVTVIVIAVAVVCITYFTSLLNKHHLQYVWYLTACLPAWCCLPVGHYGWLAGWLCSALLM